MSFRQSDVCNTPRLTKATPSIDVRISTRSCTCPFNASQNGYPNKCARNAATICGDPRSICRSTSDPDTQHWPHQYDVPPVTGDPTMPSVRIVVLVAGAE